jgi:hypothetical protein
MNSAVNWLVKALVRIDSARGFTRDHGTDHVADGECLRSLLLGLALGGERVGGFAGL